MEKKIEMRMLSCCPGSYQSVESDKKIFSTNCFLLAVTLSLVLPASSCVRTSFLTMFLTD